MRLLQSDPNFQLDTTLFHTPLEMDVGLWRSVMGIQDRDEEL